MVVLRCENDTCAGVETIKIIVIAVTNNSGKRVPVQGRGEYTEEKKEGKKIIKMRKRRRQRIRR